MGTVDLNRLDPEEWPSRISTRRDLAYRHINTQFSEWWDHRYTYGSGSKNWLGHARIYKIKKRRRIAPPWKRKAELAKG